MFSSSGHRASCHRCGNMRKSTIGCKSCPSTWCARCSERLVMEYGASLFDISCPVCTLMCCCSDDRSEKRCNRIYHCYKKCPTCKNGGFTGAEDNSPPSSKIPFMTLEESSVIVANLLRDLPHRKASRSATATAAAAAAAGGHSSSAVASGAVGSVLRSKKRDLSATSEGFLDHDSSPSFQFNLDNSSSSISPYATSAFPSSLTPGLFTDSMAMEPNQSLFSSRALSPIILDDIDSTHLFNSNDAVDVPFYYEISDQTVPAIEEHEIERVTTAVVAEPVIPPKRSHRKKEGNRSRDRKRSRTKTTPKKAATVGGKDSMQVSKNSSSSSSSSSSVALNAIARIKGSEASRASAKTIVTKSSSSATVKSNIIAKVAEDEDDDSAPQMFLPALSPLEFFPLGQFPGSTSPMLVTSREGATPRGSSAAFVLLTTKCSVMTSLASPKFVQTASTSAVITTTTSTTDGILHSPPRPLHSPRSSPLGGSPIKVQSSSSSLQVVIDQTSNASSSSSSSSVVPPPRSTRRMRAQVQYVQRGDEPDEEILLLFGTTTCDPLSSSSS